MELQIKDCCMEIDSIHIDEQEFDIFLSLKKKDKIAFLSDTMSYGIDTAMSRLSIFQEDETEIEFEADFEIDQPPTRQTKESKEIVNALFQDTFYEEQTWNNDKLNILLINNSVHLNSNSLVWIRRVVLKLFMDGHVIIRNKHAKKIPGIDKYRYYRCYDIVGQVPPICLS